MMKLDEIRKLNIESLNAKLKELVNELAVIKVERLVKNDKDTSVVGKLRKQISQVKTILREKEVLNG